MKMTLIMFNTNTKKRIAQNIKNLRTLRCMLQKDLAIMAGIGITFLSRVENEKENCCIDALIKIANALQVTIQELFEPLPEEKLVIDQIN